MLSYILLLKMCI